jgi:hypothetical protein
MSTSLGKAALSTASGGRLLSFNVNDLREQQYGAFGLSSSTHQKPLYSTTDMEEVPFRIIHRDGHFVPHKWDWESRNFRSWD